MAASSQAERENERGAAFQADLERDRAHRDKARSLKPLQRLWPFLTPYKGTIALFFLFLVAASALQLSLPGAARLLMDCGFGAAPDQAYCDAAAIGEGDDLGPYFLVGIVISLLLGLASAARFYFVSRLGERVVADLRRAVYDHITGLSPAFYETVRTGEVLSRLTTDTTLIQTVVGSSVSIALRTFATTFGAIVLMAIVSWKLTLIVLALGPLILVPIILVGRRVQRLSRDTQDELAGASARASESLANIATVQAFTREPQERARFAESVEGTFAKSMARIRTRSFMTALFFSVILSGTVCALWFGATQVQAGAITGGEMLQFMMYAFIAVSGAGFLTETWTELMRAAGATERLMELLSFAPTISAPARPVALPSRPRGEIAFENVTFSYPTRPKDKALVDFSMRIAPGETIALVGPSGAGKSTVFQLLLRFYDPQSGRILIDGVNAADLDPRALRGALSIVQQNAPLFSGSALDNIGYGRPGADAAAIRAAAKAAFADGFIEALPEGYETDLGERATTLSGGQRQRIAIARAILRDAPILLLDEATSALDAESERAVQEAFAALSKDRTTIVIAHRLATVLKADRIVVMEHGRIVEEGPHAALMANGGLYARLARLQFDLEERETVAAR